MKYIDFQSQYIEFLTQYIEFKKNNNNANVASRASYNLDLHIIFLINQILCFPIPNMPSYLQYYFIHHITFKTLPIVI